MIRVCIVDDDAIVVRSLETILTAAGDIEVVGTGASGDDAMRLVRELAPDVLLCDIQMPGGSGLAAAEELLAEDLARRIVFLTTFSDDEYIVRALRAGAAGYLIKQDVRSIAPALRAVCEGQRVLEGEVLDRAVLLSGRGSGGAGHSSAADAADSQVEAPQDAASTGIPSAGTSPNVSADTSPDESALAILTEREREVVRAVADGLDNAEIAQALFMSEGTLRNHISSILAKLGLRNRTQLAVHYWKHCR